jgi:hypothetical protein
VLAFVIAGCGSSSHKSAIQKDAEKGVTTGVAPTSTASTAASSEGGGENLESINELVLAGANKSTVSSGNEYTAAHCKGPGTTKPSLSNSAENATVYECTLTANGTGDETTPHKWRLEKVGGTMSAFAEEEPSTTPKY